MAFITIDDGYVRHPEALALIRDIREQTGAVIQAHSVTHEAQQFQEGEIAWPMAPRAPRATQFRVGATPRG